MKYFLTLMVLVTASCAKTRQEDGALTSDCKVTVLSRDAAGQLSRGVRAVNPSELVGSYYRGKELETGLLLQLGIDSKFSVKAVSCVGVLGTCTGEWQLDESGVSLSVVEAEWSRLDARPPKHLTLVTTLVPTVALVADEELDRYAAIGLVDDLTFLRQEPRKDDRPDPKIRQIGSAGR